MALISGVRESLKTEAKGCTSFRGAKHGKA